MFDLGGLSALVTGASGGIGRAIAQALSERGAQLVISGTSQERLQAAADTLGTPAHIIQCDLSAQDGAEQLAHKLSQTGVQPEILVLNAGVVRDSLMMRMRNDDWDAVMQVNLRANFQLVRAMLRPMMRARFGRIIAITSVVGALGNAGQANYAAAKAGTTAMIKSVALETANRGITANCVAPGYIDTAMTQGLEDSVQEQLLQRIPARYVGKPSHVSSAVVYLASREAAYTTGQTLHINGGMAALG